MSDTLSTGLNFASNLKLGVWALGLQPASWRGVQFAVRNSTIKRGRRIAVHEYPFRDDVWVEDLGRGTRVVSFTGFLIGDDVFAQRDDMVAAAEAPGIGELVHPSLGSLQATVTEFSAGERFDLGRVVEIEFSFIQGADAPIFPTDDLATFLKTAIAVVQGVTAIARSFQNDLNLILGVGPALKGYATSLYAGAFGVVSSFAELAGTAANDTAAIVGSVAGLPGNNGRYANTGVSVLQPASVTVESALIGVTAARTVVATAVATVNATTDSTALPAVVYAMTEAARTVAQNPVDQIRLLSGMAAFSPPITTSTSIFGVATAAMQKSMAALCRRSALLSLATATTIYQPDSYQAALAVIQSIVALFDAEILLAADAGDIVAYQALGDLRTAIVADLVARGSQLPELIMVSRRASLPSLVLAYQLYGDATRSDDLIARVNPIAPLFMPLVFQALAS